jgi:hypothetical protein
MLLGFSRRNAVRPASQKSRRPAPKRRLWFDTLEARRLLSANALTASASELAISAPGILETSSPRDVAMDSAGNAAAVWIAPDANGDGKASLNYQYYSNSAGTLTPEFGGTVATGVAPTSSGNWTGFPPVIKVAMAPSGEFVVLSETYAVTQRGTTAFTTKAQVFSPTGPATAPITVGSGSNQAVSVAMNDNGFDVLYDVVKGTALTATVQRYNAAGQTEGSPISVVPISYGTGSISMDHSGNFVVAWDTYTGAWANPGNYFYIDAQRYSSTGQAQGGVIQANSSDVAQWPNIQTDSSVSMDPVTGDFVVAWQQRVPNPITQGGTNVSDLLARQFSADGTPVQANSVITVAAATFDTGTWLNPPYTAFAEPSGGMGVNDAIGIAALPGGAGAFDVAWTNFYYTLTPTGSSTGSGLQAAAHQDIHAKSYDSLGTQTQWLAVTSDGKSSGPSAAVDGNNDLIVLWSDASQGPVQVDGQLYQPSSPSAGGFVVSAPSNITAGNSFDVTITGTDANGNPYNGTVYLGSSAASVGAVEQNGGLPASITLTNGSATFTVALETAGIQTLTATSADGSVSASATVDVAPGAVARFGVTALGGSDEDGTPISVTVTALDAYGNVATDYNGTIQLSTGDSTAVLPSNLTLVDGVATFTATFNAATQANYYITATDPTSSISGTSAAINVYPAPTKGKK